MREGEGKEDRGTGGTGGTRRTGGTREGENLVKYSKEGDVY